MPKGLSAEDRRILLANWFFQACRDALAGEAKRKYFEHAGAMLTADGTDDNLIKLEGVPTGVQFSFYESCAAMCRRGKGGRERVAQLCKCRLYTIIMCDLI